MIPHRGPGYMSKLFELIWLVPLLPFIGFLINGLGRRQISKSGAATIACGVMLVSFILSVLIFLQVRNGNTGVIHLFDFIQVDELSIPFAFQIDQLSSVFCLLLPGLDF